MPVKTAERERQPFISQPAYLRLEKHLRTNIASGLWPAGVMLPSRRTLAHSLGVDLRTLQRAIQPLLDDGTLKTSGTRGTFVARNPSTSILPDTKGHGEGTALTTPVQSGPPLRTLVVGMIDCDFLNAHNSFVLPMSWNTLIAHGVENELSEHQVLCKSFDRFDITDTGPISITTAASIMKDEGVDGIVICTMHNNMTPPVEDVLAEMDLQETPIVVVTWQPVLLPVAQVYYDSQAAGYKAAEHLLANGYSPLVYFGSVRDRWSKQRLAGVKEAVRQSNLSPTEVLVVASSDRLREGLDSYAGERGADAASFSPGIVGANDVYAYEAFDFLRKSGLEPGTRFGVVGFDNSMGARRNGLTSMDPSMEVLGKEAAHLILRLIAGEKTPTHIKAYSRLVVRDSTRPHRDRALP